MSDALWQRGARALATAIRSREVSSREVLEAHLERIATVNPQVQAITEVLEESARAAADAADAALARGDAAGPLHGVPVTVKVNVDVAGSPTTAGMPVFAGDRPASDAPAIERLRAAGAIPFARTNMPDLGLRWHTESSLHGSTRNPWDPRHTPGGSSGGEAVAIATGMSPLGLGNDIGGSVRWPSQCCGTTAIRPTQGLIPHYDSTVPLEVPLAFRLFLTDGPMARHVGDLALALSVLAGADPRDPWSLSPAAGNPGTPLRIAVTTDPGGLGCDATIAAGVRRAADLLAAAGCRVETADPPAVAEAHELWGTLLSAETRTMVLPFARSLLAADALTVIEHLMAAFPILDLAGYMEALARRTRVAREWSRFLDRYDVVLGPVGCRPPFRPGDDLTAAGMAAIMGSMRLVTACNLLGLPAAVVPVGIAGGLPQAVQLIATRYREDRCLAAAEMIERRTEPITPIDPRRA
jgi:amidase